MNTDLKRYKYGYVSDEWGMERHLGLIADPAGNVCLFADAQAEIDRHKLHIKHIGNDALRTENAELRARLAELEAQEPVGRLTGCADEELDGTHGYAAAGAAPVATAQPDDCANTPYDEGPFTTAQPSQAREQLSTEQLRCMEEAHNIAHGEAHFSARPFYDSTESRRVFAAAHRMGWNAAINAKESKL